MKPMAMAAWIGFIHLIEGNYLNPKIIGGAAHIHPVIVVFALLAGESVYGLTGALFAVPVASMIQTVFVFARRRARGFAAVEEREVSAGSGDEVAAGSEESSKAPDGLEVE